MNVFAELKLLFIFVLPKGKVLYIALKCTFYKALRCNSRRLYFFVFSSKNIIFELWM